MISCGKEDSVIVVRPQPRTQSLDISFDGLQPTILFKEKDSFIANSTSSDLFRSEELAAKTEIDSTQVFESTIVKEENSSYSAKLTNNADSLESGSSVECFSSVTGKISPGKTNDIAQNQPVKESNDCTVTRPRTTGLSNQQRDVPSEHTEQGSTHSAAVSEGDSGIDPGAEGVEEEGNPGSAANKPASRPEGMRDADASRTSAEVFSKIEQQDKKKGEVFFFTFYFTVMSSSLYFGRFDSCVSFCCR